MSNENEQPQEADVKLDLQDLAGAVRVIDMAVERGAIKGEEAAVVGTIRDNIVRFIRAHAPAVDPEAEEALDEEAATSEE
jgi:hypothetical protein